MKATLAVLLTFMLNAAWQVALLAGFATLGDWILRDMAARNRHALWVVALIASFVFPLLTCSPLLKPHVVSSQSQIPTSVGPVVISRILESESVENAEPQGVVRTVSPATARRSFLISPLIVDIRPAGIVSALYLLFVLYRAAKLFRAWRRTQAIISATRPVDFSERMRTIITRCQKAIGVERLRILRSAMVPVPITVGFRNPLVILPEELLKETDEAVLTSAIGHELVHVARHDYTFNLLFELIYLPISFHPAAALMRNRIKQTRELCCDERVTESLVKREYYARSLVRLIGSVPISRRLAANTTIGITEADILEVRIMSLLRKPNLTTRRRTLLLVAASLLLITPCVAAAKLGLNLSIAEPEEQTQQPVQQAKQELQQQEKRQSEELQRLARELEEQLRTAPESQRGGLEKRLLEVKRNLEQHERTREELQWQRKQKEETLRQAREHLAQLEKIRPANEAQMDDMRKQIAELERMYEVTRRRAFQGNIEQTQKSEKDKRAKIIYKVEPEYPEDARAKKIEGTVLLAMTIDHDGVPQNITVKKSLYPSIDQSAIEAVRKWRFEPAMKDGQPVSMWITVEVYFGSETNRLDQEQKEREAREKEEMEERDAKLRNKVSEKYDETRLNRERDERERDEKYRGAGLAVAKWVKISMAQAIQIATSKYPGTVLQCRLLGEREDKVFYQVLITSGDADNVTYVWVSAIDGQILKAEEEKRRSISGGKVNGNAISLPQPEYPQVARAAQASGTVTVQVTIDEEGNVIAAKAVSGHPLLQAASVTAARQAKFRPTYLNGEPVKVTGLVTYNFEGQW